MQRTRKVAEGILLFVGLIAVVLTGASHAEQFTMQLPANPNLTYRITAANQQIWPAPLPRHPKIYVWTQKNMRGA